MLIKKVLWIGFGIFILPIIVFQGYVVYKEVFSNTISFKNIGTFILLFELLLASVIAFLEKGHFPIRYLLIFILSALIFYLALSKHIMEWYIVLTHVFSIVLFSLLYILIKILDKKFNLSE